MADARARRAAMKRASHQVKSGGTFFRRASTAGVYRAPNAPSTHHVKKQHGS